MHIDYVISVAILQWQQMSRGLQRHYAKWTTVLDVMGGSRNVS